MSTIKELVAVEVAKHLAPAISESAQRHLASERIDSIVGPLVEEVLKELLGDIESTPTPTPTPKTSKTTRVKEATSKAKAKTTGTSYIEVSTQTADAVGLDRMRVEQAKDEAKARLRQFRKEQGGLKGQDFKDYTGLVNCTTGLSQRVSEVVAKRYPNAQALSQIESAIDIITDTYRAYGATQTDDLIKGLYDAYGHAIEQCAKAHEAKTDKAKAQLALYESEGVIA